MTETLAQSLAGFAAGLNHDSVPASVREAALWHIVDSIGVSVAGASEHEESGVAFRRYAEKSAETGSATLLGLGRTAGPEIAALVNGSLAQALEMDDKHGYSLARPGSTIVPAVLAMAEARDLSLRDAVTAVIAGYEVMIRLGLVAGERFLERGYHTSSLLGAFGVTAAIGRLLGTDAATIVNAMGIAGTFASGIQESTRTGSTSKILHGGWGAHAGIIALQLASAGISGPSSVFEGKFGFFETHLTPITGKLDFVFPAADFGSRWYLPETAFKPYPCCQLLHAFIEAAKQLLVEFARGGISLGQVEHILCQLAEPGLTLVTDPIENKRAPWHPHEARFSLPFGVASALVHGDVGLESFRQDRLGEAAVLRLASLVEAAVDPDSDYPKHCPAILTIRAAGKDYRCHVPFHPGSPEAPLSQSDVLDKFARNTGWLFGDTARETGAAIGVADEAQSVRSLIRNLGALGTSPNPAGVSA